MSWRLDEAWVRLEGAPTGADTKEVLRALARGLVATKRFKKVLVGGKRPSGAATVRVTVETSETPYGVGHGFAFTITGADGAVVDEHPVYVTAIGPATDLHVHAEGAALVVADEARYPKLVTARGQSGNVQHPRRARLDPQSVLMHGVLALQNGQPQGLKNVAGQALEAAAAATGAGERRHLRRLAADLFCGLGDGTSARAAIALALLDDAPPDDEAFGLRRRFVGAGAQQALGDTFAPALVVLGCAVSSLRRDHERRDDLFRVIAALSFGHAPSLLRSEEDMARLFQPQGLMDVLGERFGPVAGFVAHAALLIDYLAHAPTEDPRPVAEAIQAARPLLALAIGDDGVERVTAGLRKGDARGARSALEPAEERFDAHRCAWDGMRALREGRPEDALAVLRGGPPDSVPGLSVTALVAASTGRPDVAVGALRALVARAPRQAEAQAFLAGLLHDLGEPGAEAPLETALELDPWNTDARLARGVSRSRRGDVDGALADLEVVRGIDGPSPNLAYTIGTTLLDGGRYADALPHLTSATRATKVAPEWLVNRGICLFRLGRHRDAILDLTAGHEAKPTLMNAVGHRGLARAALGQTQAARADLVAYLKTNVVGSFVDECRATLERL